MRQKKKVPTEAEEQIFFTTWLTRFLADKDGRFTASANGGSRNLLEAVKFKRMGVSKGFPDIEVPFPIKPYHGLYLELKRVSGGRASVEQVEWIDYLRKKGYYADFARGFEEAKEIVLHYFSSLAK